MRVDHADYMCSHQVVAGTLYNFDIKLKLKSDCARKKETWGLWGITLKCHAAVYEGPQQQRTINQQNSFCQDVFGHGGNHPFPRNDQHPDYYRDALKDYEYYQDYASPQDYQGNPFASEWSTLQVTDYDGGVAMPMP